MTTSRFLCPLDCGWHHDQEDPVPDPALAQLPLPTAELAGALLLGHRQAVEAALRAHLETHELIEWVKGLTSAQQQIATMQAEQARYEETVVGALNETITRLSRQVAHAEAEPGKVDQVLRDNGFEYPLGAAGVRDMAAQRQGFLDELKTAERRVASLEKQLAAVTATCDASAAVPTFGTVGPCVLRRHHPGPVHKAADGATWSQVLPFPYDEVRCGSCDELEDDCTCSAETPPGSPDGRHGYAGESERLPDGSCPDWCPCHRLRAEAEPTTCPTVCEPDCRDECHADHQPAGERDHEPDDCPGFRPTRWPFWPRNPSWMGKPLPTMQETARQALNDLAERGIRLVVPGYDTPPAPTWPYGVPRGDWVTVFANDWPDDPPPVRELTPEESERLDAETAMSGVDTAGCDCGHEGLGLRWHASDCDWRKAQR